MQIKLYIFLIYKVKLLFMSAILIQDTYREVKIMIIPINGNVTYPITLDPTVWIFDDRKILFEEAFEGKQEKQGKDSELERASKRWDREVYQQSIKPPVNQSIKKFERDKILTNSYVIPLEDFIANAEVKPSAKHAILITGEKEIKISLTDLTNSYFLFAVEGKPLKEDGPVHLYYKDGSNRDNPIKHITKIVIE
ncbi:hypothetical protein [Oceanobacillus kapialis]|uniref:Peptidyl-prolyl cis-trans isomerase n=1 Tax=Oceanobacillus kapialis TaxID=481353 RepID=A0ABW5PY29_9BACI